MGKTIRYKQEPDLIQTELNFIIVEQFQKEIDLVLNHVCKCGRENCRTEGNKKELMAIARNN